MKKLILLITACLLCLFSLNAADYYAYYQANFEAETPQSLFVKGFDCADNTCQNVKTNKVEIYKYTQAKSCLETYKSNKNANALNSCIEETKITGDILDLDLTNRFVAKYSSVRKNILHISTNNDSYKTWYAWFDIRCHTPICIREDIFQLNFKKVQNAQAEVQQLNIINTDNPLYPVQIEVPIEIDETVCSAYRRANNYWLPVWPETYSDLSAKTQIDLTIKDTQTNQVYYSETKVKDILADTCTGSVNFNWMPSATLLNTEVEFKVETNVIDNQVATQTPDYTTAIHTIYPQDLTNTAYAQIQNFTLSNVESFNLNPSVAQITKGEYLYAKFKAGAYMNDSVEPIDFRVDIYFNDALVYRETKQKSSTQKLQTININLTNHVLNLPVDEYVVKVVITPDTTLNPEITTTSSTTQIQNLKLREIEYSEVGFVVVSGDEYVENASITLEFLNDDNYYLNSKTYNKINTTNSQGEADFSGVYRGTYRYTILKENCIPYTNQIFIGSNKNIYKPIECVGAVNNGTNKTPLGPVEPQEFMIKLNVLENQNLGLVPLNFLIERETSIIKRIVSVTPTLVCNNLENNYEGGALQTRIVSSAEGVKNSVLYMDTNNFISQVPTNVLCDLSVELVDNFGSEPIVLTAKIKFIGEQITTNTTPTTTETSHWSLRGYDVDIYDYKKLILQPASPGYNYFDVNLYNHKSNTEEITVTTSSTELSFSKTRKVRVLPNENKIVEVPIYVNNRVKEGTYPIRIAINQDGKKQVRYTYLKVE